MSNCVSALKRIFFGCVSESAVAVADSGDVKELVPVTIKYLGELLELGFEFVIQMSEKHGGEQVTLAGKLIADGLKKSATEQLDEKLKPELERLVDNSGANAYSSHIQNFAKVLAEVDLDKPATVQQILEGKFDTELFKNPEELKALAINALASKIINLAAKSGDETVTKLGTGLVESFKEVLMAKSMQELSEIAHDPVKIRILFNEAKEDAIADAANHVTNFAVEQMLAKLNGGEAHAEDTGAAAGSAAGAAFANAHATTDMEVMG